MPILKGVGEKEGKLEERRSGDSEEKMLVKMT